MNKKEEIISQIAALLAQLISEDGNKPAAAETPKADGSVEMLTIKECIETVKGLSEHTVRQLVAQGKLPYIRTGQGKRGKILISKAALLSYFNGVA